MRVVCPKCKKAYSVDAEKIDFNNRKIAKCIKCQSSFYLQKKEKIQNGAKKTSRITFLQSYFEKRGGSDRRKCSDRRKKIKTENIPLLIPSDDVILILNDEDHPVGYLNNGRRRGADRRRGKERRDFQELRSKTLFNN